jgi:tRNA threonylcarbamoyladenosine biosynthesis protein TsaB
MALPGILGFDTATADAAVAVAVGGELVSERRKGPDPGGRPRHAAVLMGEIEAAVAPAGGWKRIDQIAVGIGPGTFTGLRVGIATARALGQARGLPVAAVGSLAALAQGAAERAPDRPRLALIDARRGEVFAALYDASAIQLWEPATADPEALARRLAGLDRAPVAVGDGSLRFRRQLESAGVEIPPDADPAHHMAARHICALAATIEPGPSIDVKPAYLRRPDAEVWREQRDRDPRTG